MQITIAQLNSIERTHNRIIMRGDGGTITIDLLSGNNFYILYHFNGLTLPKLIDEAIAAACPYNSEISKKGDTYTVTNIHEDDRYYTIKMQNHEIKTEKNFGTISIFRKGKLIHGGTIGTVDSVVPHHPLRVQKHGAGGVAEGKFNFPLRGTDAFFGFGEKTGHLNKYGRVLKMYSKDALGYHADYSDPLYKSIPFFMKYNTKAKTLVGIFFPAPSVTEINLGVESIFYYCIKLSGGPFGYYVFSGDNYGDIIKEYLTITGKPALPPLYTFGFFGSSMHYSDPENAEEKILDFFKKVEKHNIPCEGMYLSSGYTKTKEGNRYSLVWNRDKFKSPQSFFSGLRKRGYKVCCNVKPGFLKTHPLYRTISEHGYFIKDMSGSNHMEYYWGGYASLFDFSNRDAVSWWKRQIEENFIYNSISGIWNDNNEYELENKAIPQYYLRSILPILMAKSSFEAYRKINPRKRPWIISRSGGAGIQRYARTWTGDNTSSFTTLAFNILMGVNLGLSGIPFYGHDIGGFFGKLPSKELLLRWCQNGVFQPRFVIHSWNDGGEPTEPWTYYESLNIIKKLIRIRYLFMPYLYNTAITASETGTPMQRPLFLEFPADNRINMEDLNYLFGDSILVPTVASGKTSIIDVYLPETAQWYDPQEARLYPGGESLTLRYSPNEFRYFIKTGSIIPTSPGLQSLDHGFFGKIDFLLFPGEDILYSYYEDDGITDYKTGSYNIFNLAMQEIKTNLHEKRKYELAFSRETSCYSSGKERYFSFTLPDGFLFSKDTLTLNGNNNIKTSFRGKSLIIKYRGIPDTFSVIFEGTYK